MANVKSISKKITIGPVRLSYEHVHAPSAQQGSTKLKYSGSLVIQKSDKATIDLINKTVQEIYAASEKLKKDGKLVPFAAIDNPLRDGDIQRSNDEAYKGAFYLSAKSDDKPALFDQKRAKLLDATEIYSGCYVNVSISLYDYNTAGKLGIAVGLNGVQKHKDGAPLSGKGATADDFSEVAESDDDI
jgi:hypothetical protein